MPAVREFLQSLHEVGMKSDDEASKFVTESNDLPERIPGIDNLPGVILELGQLGSGAVVTEEGIAGLFNRHESSVKRAVQRGELPPPVRMFGQNTWTAGVLVSHIEARLASAAQDAESIERKLVELKP